MNTPDRPHIWLVAGEESGDQLGAKLMQALKTRYGADGVTFGGVGGRAMTREGLESLFPMTDIAVNGVSAVIAQLPTIVGRVYRTVDAVVAARPDALVIIDSPDFTHQVARRVRRRAPDIPIVNYVSPSVWAWRPGRAKTMRAYVDHVLALKPFEPDAHRRLGGPACTYVGHPLIERLAEVRPAAGERRPLGDGPVKLLVLPGSRRSEVTRLMEPFGQALNLLQARSPLPFEVCIPVVDHVAGEVEARVRNWSIQPRLVHGEAAKWAAFRESQAALAASGTVTLELALSGVPMVVAYKVSKLEEQLRFFIKVPSIVLANLILGDRIIPEFVQWDCTPEKLADGLLSLLKNSPERRRQLDGFAKMETIMSIGEDTPSGLAAGIVANIIEGRGRRAS